MRDALTWYVVVQVAGLACWPLVARALGPFADRGWAISKTAGLLGIAWLVWFVCMLTPLPFTRVTLLVAVLIVGAVAWLLAARSAGGLLGVRDWVVENRWLLLAGEALFLVTYLLFAVLRSRDPAAASTEKPMDMAFLIG